MSTSLFYIKTLESEYFKNMSQYAHKTNTKLKADILFLVT